MSLLLDTHVWIWSQECPEKIGAKALGLLKDPKVALHVSTVSTLEIARLVAMRAIELDGSVLAWVNDTLGALQCSSLEVSHEIAVGAYSLPGDFHKDPADRILVSTARHLDLTLLTADERILDYPDAKSRDVRR